MALDGGVGRCGCRDEGLVRSLFGSLCYGPGTLCTGIPTATCRLCPRADVAPAHRGQRPLSFSSRGRTGTWPVRAQSLPCLLGSRVQEAGQVGCFSFQYLQNPAEPTHRFHPPDWAPSRPVRNRGQALPGGLGRIGGHSVSGASTHEGTCCPGPPAEGASPATTKVPPLRLAWLTLCSLNSK